jgi:hypothetical protein
MPGRLFSRLTLFFAIWVAAAPSGFFSLSWADFPVPGSSARPAGCRALDDHILDEILNKKLTHFCISDSLLD